VTRIILVYLVAMKPKIPWSKRLSVILVPEGGARTLSFQVRTVLLLGFVAITLFLLAATGTLLVSRGRLLVASRDNVRLQRRVRLMEVELEKVRTLERQLAHSERLRTEVLTLLGARGEPLDSMHATPETVALASYGTDELRLRQQDFLRSVPTTWPTRGPVTRAFVSPGSAEQAYHPGIDVAAAAGTPVIASAAGSVTFSGTDPVYGNLVVIDHGLGLETRYAHNARLNVRPGARVSRGQLIATVGSTGNSTAPHLHFEIHKSGVPIDPRKYLD
jgi:murein DD-endopeptidase MepM/ murein hydrolase activator NlpD